VLTFAGQVKHVAAGNYFIWSKVAGDKVAEELFNDGKGPDNLKTKAEIIQFLKNSFVLAHKTAATLTPENMLQSAGGSTRISLATFGIGEAYNHHGQMVEYLRMNGIVPPASRAKSDWVVRIGLQQAATRPISQITGPAESALDEGGRLTA
jgi:hypothetical protein